MENQFGLPLFAPLAAADEVLVAPQRSAAGWTR
jgi:hypothetical protein